MRAVQVSWHADAEGRSPARLLDAWPTLVETAAAAARAGVHVTVVQAADDDATVERAGVRFEFVRVRRTGSPRRRVGPWAAPVDRRILDRIAALEPAVLHQHGLTHPLHARALADRMCGTPLLVQDHASRPPRRLRRVYRFGLAHVQAFAFTAHEQAAPFVAAGALSPSARIVELLESSSRFTPGNGAADRAAEIDGEPCLLWVGRLDANKDPHTVLSGIERAAETLRGIRLWMVYRDAPLLDDVRDRIAASPVLRERVTLLGARSPAQVEMLLRAADFLVLGSRFEGSGYAAIEALACGTTPIVTDIPSFRRITARGTAGGLFHVGDVDALADAILAWSAKDRAKLRRDARVYFERSLSFDVVGRELAAAYADLASGSR